MLLVNTSFRCRRDFSHKFSLFGDGYFVLYIKLVYLKEYNLSKLIKILIKQRGAPIIQILFIFLNFNIILSGCFL